MFANCMPARPAPLSDADIDRVTVLDEVVGALLFITRDVMAGPAESITIE